VWLTAAVVCLRAAPRVQLLLARQWSMADRSGGGLLKWLQSAASESASGSQSDNLCCSVPLPHPSARPAGPAVDGQCGRRASSYVTRTRVDGVSSWQPAVTCPRPARPSDMPVPAAEAAAAAAVAVAVAAVSR